MQGRKLHDWPFRDRPEVNGAFFVLVLVGVMLMVWIVVLMAVINADVH